MNQILDAIKCKNCQQVLRAPVLLPCHHSICASHVPKGPNCQVACMRCGVQHVVPENGFLLNEQLAVIIQAQIQELNLGPVHEEAKKACLDLEALICEVKAMVDDPAHVFNEKIDEMQNKVLKKKEELKLKIEQETEKLLEILNKHREKCKQNLETQDFQNQVSEMNIFGQDSGSRVSEWLKLLDEVKVNEEKWKQIIEESKQENANLAEKINSIKKTLLLPEFEENKDQIDFFQRINLYSVFFYAPM